jgi:hypothetical protein
LLTTTALQRFLLVTPTLDALNTNLPKCGKESTDNAYRTNPRSKIAKGRVHVATRWRCTA